MPSKNPNPRMHRLQCFILVVILFTLGAVTEAAPQIRFDKTSHSFGARRSSETVRVVFTIRNTGDDVLQISKINAACGCTVAELDKRQIEPGQSVPLEVAFSLRGRSGPQQKTVSVVSNDPDRRVSHLVLKVTVEEAPSWTPRSINFGRVGANEALSRNALLSGFRDPPTVAGVRCDSPAFTARWVNKPGTAGHLLVQTKPRLQVGSHRGQVEISTDHPDYPTMTLPVFAYVPPPLRVVPSTLLLLKDKGREGQATIMVLGEVESFRVKRVGHPPNVAVQVKRQAANRWTITLSGLEPNPALDGKKIQIETDVKGMETVVVPIRVRGLLPPKKSEDRRP